MKVNENTLVYLDTIIEYVARLNAELGPKGTYYTLKMTYDDNLKCDVLSVFQHRDRVCGDSKYIQVSDDDFGATQLSGLIGFLGAEYKKGGLLK